MMARVFGEAPVDLPDPYLEYLLRRTDFWAVAALAGAEVVGGLTAHVLPLTTKASAELFVYDLAVRPDRQRQGVGRRLIASVREAAGAVGVGVVFVAADNTARAGVLPGARWEGISRDGLHVLPRRPVTPKGRFDLTRRTP